MNKKLFILLLLARVRKKLW